MIKNYNKKNKILLAKGDGIGPEISDSVINILEAANAPIDFIEVTLGEKAFTELQHSTGVSPNVWELIKDHGYLLKGPLTTPQGKGYKSVNVTLRKTLGLFANIRPCYFPGKDVNVIIVRENEEDLYAGVEHRQTQEMTQCLKLISRPGSERVIRYAFELANSSGRSKVTVFVKDNIMKLTDGLFHKIFDVISKEYPDIESNVMIVDIGIAKLAAHPEEFDVVISPNLYGDIISDVVAEVSGSVAIAPSINIGEKVQMYEAVHGSAPDIAGKGIANPSALLLSSLSLLEHIGEGDIANNIRGSWEQTVKTDILTKDLDPVNGISTAEFEKEIINRIKYNYPSESKKIVWPNMDSCNISEERVQKKKHVGVDIFLDWSDEDRNPNNLAKLVKEAIDPLNVIKLKIITNRGVKVWPYPNQYTLKTDHWRLRFISLDYAHGINNGIVADAINSLEKRGLDVIKLENLYTFDDVLGFSLAQGEEDT